MHPCFGTEFKCPSLEWKELMKGPSREAVLAHAHKVLNYRSLFDPNGAARGSDWEQLSRTGEAGTGRHKPARDRAEAA
jgi:hypothetical protein